MTTNLRIRLTPGYREPLSSGAGFVGRESELAQLVAVLRDRPSATVLVSGHRGVGKTTLVDEALRRTEKPATVIARLSLPHIEPGEDHSSRDLRGQILRSLTRSLYFALKALKAVDKGVLSQAQTLYDKTYLKDLQESGQLEALTQAETRQVEAVRRENHFDPGKVLGVVLGAVGAGAVAAVGIGLAAIIGTDHGAVWGVLAFVLVLACSIAAGISATKVKTEERSATEQVLKKRSATQVGSFDLSPETLEFELKGLLGDMDAAGLRPIFVIDELDKLEVRSTESADALEQHAIFLILSCLKNFFTLGSGIFIFISGEDFYARLEESDETETYSLAHTLFTDRVFVHVLQWRDVEQLIDNLVASPPDDAQTYARFRNYLCWESRNHAFDLLTRVGDYVADYDGDTPILVAHESSAVDGRWHEGNLPSDWILAAGLQKIVGATFDESARPGGRAERFNQALWLLLLDTAKALARDGVMTVPVAGYELEPSRWTEHLGDRDLDDLAGAIDRLLARAERYGIVTTTSTQLTREPGVHAALPSAADGAAEPALEPEAVPATEYTVIVDPPYPDSSVGTHAAPSPFEEGFLRIAHAAREAYDNLVAAGLNPARFEEPLADVQRTAALVTDRTARQAPPRSRVRSALRRADELLPALWAAGVDEIVQTWADNLGFEVWMSSSAQAPPAGADAQTTAAPEAASDAPDLGEFAPLLNILSETDTRYHLIETSNTENQVLVVEDVDASVAERMQTIYKDVTPGRKGQERRVQRLPIVEVRRTPPDEIIDLPQEVITVVEANPATGFVAWMSSWFSGSDGSSQREVTELLAGWHVFGLQPSASNVADLRDLLTDASYMSVGSETPAPE